MKRILITGGNGYIGTSLRNGLAEDHEITTVTRADFDVSDSKSTRDWFDGKHFDVLIHTAIAGGSRLRIDGFDVVDTNLKMYYNLLDNRSHFDRFISIGSGAEIYSRNTPYGLSKHVIRQSMMNKDDFYNLRVFAVFDENELATRFIKSSILNHINFTPIVITQDKHMDFFYMKDFVNLVKYYIMEKSPAKEVDCTYSSTPTLRDIADKVNSLGPNPVEVRHIAEGLAHHYSAEYPRSELPIDVYGLNRGIELTYEALCKI
jgi:nucleoside-diphosphate-sugar epimerase